MWTRLNMPKRELVLLADRTLAEIIRRGAYASLVKFTRGGIDYEVIVENEDFEDYQGTDNDTDED